MSERGLAYVGILPSIYNDAGLVFTDHRRKRGNSAVFICPATLFVAPAIHTCRFSTIALKVHSHKNRCFGYCRIFWSL